MSIPKPPFHSISEELLYNIYLKLDAVGALQESDINTLAKLNALLTDAELLDRNEIESLLYAIKGNVPAEGNSLEKLYAILQGLNFLSASDIDTLAEINNVLTDADLVKTEDLQIVTQSIKGNVPELASTLEKIYNLFLPSVNAWVFDGNTNGRLKSIGTKDAFSLPFITSNIERARIDEFGHFIIGANRNGFSLPGGGTLAGYKLQVVNSGTTALGVSGDVFIRDGHFTVNLSQEGNPSLLRYFRINSYWGNSGTLEFIFSAANPNAGLELIDAYFGGTKSEVLRVTTAGYSNTGIMVKPNDLYHTAYGYRYLINGVNQGLQSRYIAGYHAEVNLPLIDNYAGTNSTQLFVAKAVVKNHFVDGFFADVTGDNPGSAAYAFRSVGSRNMFNGEGMSFYLPVITATSDFSAHVGANGLMLNGSYVVSAVMQLIPLGAERTGLIISPGQATSNGLFIGPQHTLGSYNYDGYLLWLQYSTTGNNMNGATSKPMLYIRKHNARLNGFDHTGAFIRMEENINSTGDFIEAYKFDQVSNSLRLKFAVNKDGVLSIGQVPNDQVQIAEVGRLYFVGEELRLVTPSGVIRTVRTQ
ncbi:MAG: hypothetical protein O9340_07920 [Cyclobacteriaceae bacterium]|nr:hypothetical protein [Cyclobacteriaceae bacterium]